VVIVVIVNAASGGGSKSTTVGAALNNDVNTVASGVADVQVTFGTAVQSPSIANLNALAQEAQQAHDTLASLKDQIAADGGNSDVFGAVNDLKNSMGALVTYTGNPNPATLASFTTQYNTAVGEWNDAITSLYSGKTQPPPTIATS
jgi:hypothetical protein